MRSCLLLVILLVPQLSAAAANRVPVSKLLDQMIRRSTLAEPGGTPFYLKATITDKDDAKSEFNGTLEEYWLSPTKWRRVVKLRDFSQTRILNGDQVYEENIGDYFPVHDEMLANEIVDPLPKPAVDLMNQLGLMGVEPGSGQGQCMAEKYFNNSEGRETRVLLGVRLQHRVIDLPVVPDLPVTKSTPFLVLHLVSQYHQGPLSCHQRTLEEDEHIRLDISRLHSFPVKSEIGFFANYRVRLRKAKRLVSQFFPCDTVRARLPNMTKRLIEGRTAMRFTVTGSTTCPKCKYSRSFTSELDAESDEAAMQRFKDNHRYCFMCSLFGVQTELNFDSYMQVKERLSGR